MYSYLMSSFTKTYIVFNDANATFYFKGNKSILSISVPLESPIAETYQLSVDIQKFLSAAKKIARGDSLILTFSVSPPQLMLSSNISSDKINLGVEFYDDQSTEVTSLASFYTENEKRFEDGTTIQTTNEFLDFVHITSAYMSNINKNNSIAIYDDKLMYADRTVVLSSNTKVVTAPITEPILMHRFILNFLEFVAVETPSFIVDENKQSVLWRSSEDEGFWAILAIDPCNIAIPEATDIAGIVPEDTKKQTVLVKPEMFTEAIDFFNGLFEAAVWKPITFFWNLNGGDQKIKLTYHHPSTEVEKNLICEEFVGNLDQTAETASFILISDSIRTLLSRLDNEGMIKLSFNDEAPDVAHGAGVYLTYEDKSGNELYNAVLAKLQDN